MTKGKVNSYGKIDLKVKNIKYNEPMSGHTSFRVGGCVDILIEPVNIRELIKTIKFLNKTDIPYFIMGNGSNLLVSDNGIRGAVVKIAEKFNSILLGSETITAESGVLLSTLSKAAAKAELTGLEFASGIPGTLGGALAMNAGAYSGEMKDIVEWVEVLDEKYTLIRLYKNEMGFEYRRSVIQANNYIAIRCCMKLNKGNQSDITAIMNDYTNRRKTKQPLHLPSAGSTFKRPKGYFAGKLIEDSGLKGFQIGEAQISTQHCGFVVNLGNATADDIYKLITHAKQVVHNKYGVELETEVRLVGDF